MEAGWRSQIPKSGLAAKLAVCVGGGAFLFIAVLGLFQLRMEQRHLESLVSISADRIVDIIHSSARQDMMDNDRSRLYSLIENFGHEPGIRKVRIFDEIGRIQYSTDPKEVGQVVDQSAEACYGCHAVAQPLGKLARKDRVRIFAGPDGKRTLAAIRPIENAPQCSNAACHAHPASKQVLGVIDTHLALDAVDEKLAEDRKQMAWFMGFAAVLACGLALLFVFLTVARPVKLLMRGLTKVSEGDLSHRIPVTTKDELGVLAAAFNEMAVDLNAAREESNSWARTLEDRVHQKTEELEKAHSVLVNSEKMASLGRLAATVAHEVNNPLFGMLTYARLTLKEAERLPPDHPARARMIENLRVIERESRRCGDLMKNLLAFARQSPPKRAPLQVNEVVRRAMVLVQHQYDLQQTELHAELDPNLPEIEGDAAQLQQILLVLLTNAGEALGQEGAVTVRTTARPGGEGVTVSVKDTGPGIPPDIQATIFEPFFTTKDNQHRTGLGLAIARGIAERHGGTLTLHSQPSGGAEFVVQLPPSAPEEVGSGQRSEYA